MHAFTKCIDILSCNAIKSWRFLSVVENHTEVHQFAIVEHEYIWSIWTSHLMETCISLHSLMTILGSCECFWSKMSHINISRISSHVAVQLICKRKALFFENPPQMYFRDFAITSRSLKIHNCLHATPKLCCRVKEPHILKITRILKENKFSKSFWLEAIACSFMVFKRH